MRDDRTFQALASRFARNPKEENRILSQLKFAGMANVGRGKSIKNVSFVETATPLPFAEDFKFPCTGQAVSRDLTSKEPLMNFQPSYS